MMWPGDRFTSPGRRSIRMRETWIHSRAAARLGALAPGAAALALLAAAAFGTVELKDFLADGRESRTGENETGLATGTAEQRSDPLFPYQRFAEITRDLDAAGDAAIEGFLAEFPDTPLEPRLRRAYLKRLAAEGRWADYSRVYRPDDSAPRRCLYLRALIETGRADYALGQVEPLWLVGRSQPAVCDALFDAWVQSGALTEGLVWERIRLAMEAGSARLARYLGKFLSEPERAWLDRWLTLHDDPARVLDPLWRSAEHPRRPAMLAHGITRLARRSAGESAAALDRLEDLLVEDPPALNRARTAVARALARAKDSRSLAYWDRVAATDENLRSQEDRLRVAIGLGAWERVADWVARMPDGETKRDRWLYWEARAQAALGRDAKARATYERAAAQRSFWGFMAADRVGEPYHLKDTPVPADPERVRTIAASAAMARILELRRLGREADMRREWQHLTRGLGDTDLMAAALVAQSIGWHDQAVFTLALTGYWDDLGLRFPIEHHDLIAEQAWQTGLPEDWIFAVIRQESVFARTIASPAGALGLMQLMPATAREVALDLGVEPPSRSTLLDPALNIVLGSGYLARMRDRFGHPALATAAYNAGPHRVERWLPETCTEADLWIAGIPFDETRGYVERVLAYRMIYRARLGLPERRLSDLLRPVPAKADFRSSPQPDVPEGLVVAVP